MQELPSDQFSIIFTHDSKKVEAQVSTDSAFADQLLPIENLTDKEIKINIKAISKAFPKDELKGELILPSVALKSNPQITKWVNLNNNSKQKNIKSVVKVNICAVISGSGARETIISDYKEKNQEQNQDYTKQKEAAKTMNEEIVNKINQRNQKMFSKIPNSQNITSNSSANHLIQGNQIKKPNKINNNISTSSNGLNNKSMDSRKIQMLLNEDSGNKGSSKSLSNVKQLESAVIDQGIDAKDEIDCSDFMKDQYIKDINLTSSEFVESFYDEGKFKKKVQQPEDTLNDSSYSVKLCRFNLEFEEKMMGEFKDEISNFGAQVNEFTNTYNDHLIINLPDDILPLKMEAASIVDKAVEMYSSFGFLMKGFSDLSIRLEEISRTNFMKVQTAEAKVDRLIKRNRKIQQRMSKKKNEDGPDVCYNILTSINVLLNHKSMEKVNPSPRDSNVDFNDLFKIFNKLNKSANVGAKPLFNGLNYKLFIGRIEAAISHQQLISSKSCDVSSIKGGRKDKDISLCEIKEENEEQHDLMKQVQLKFDEYKLSDWKPVNDTGDFVVFGVKINIKLNQLGELLGKKKLK